MISQKTINAAVEQNIINLSQADSLKLIQSNFTKADNIPNFDHEKFRFISGFGDIFVVIGIVLLFGSSGYLLFGLKPAYMVCLILTLLAWGLAEVFTLKQKMAFPSIVLMLFFTIFVFLTSVMVLSSFGDKPLDSNVSLFYFYAYKNNWQFTSACLITFLSTCLHYWRFKVPITVALGAAALASLVYSFFATIFPAFVNQFGSWLFLCAGLIIFISAMKFDSSDLKRETRKTDIAFWLHLLAAPLIVHSFINVVFVKLSAMSFQSAFGLLFIFLILAIFAVLIDRRAILVSGLTYAGIAFGSLFKDAFPSSAIIPVTILVLGVFILTLSVGWNSLRGLFLCVLPESLKLKLPPQKLLGNT